MRDVTIGQVREAVIAVDFYYEESDAGQFPPVVRNIEVRSVTSQKSNYGLLLRGYPHSPVSDIRLRDCTFDNVARADIMENVQRILFANVKINGKVLNQNVTQ